MSEESLNFGDIEIEKKNYRNKTLTFSFFLGGGL